MGLESSGDVGGRYLHTGSTACTVTRPQLVAVLLERPDPTHIREALLIATVTLLSIPQYDIMGDVTFSNGTLF